jgi:hypothetical protein
MVEGRRKMVSVKCRYMFGSLAGCREADREVQTFLVKIRSAIRSSRFL